MAALEKLHNRPTGSVALRRFIGELRFRFGGDQFEVAFDAGAASFVPFCVQLDDAKQIAFVFSKLGEFCEGHPWREVDGPGCDAPSEPTAERP